jgi:hypothetical protein
MVPINHKPNLWAIVIIIAWLLLIVSITVYK